MGAPCTWLAQPRAPPVCASCWLGGPGVGRREQLAGGQRASALAWSPGNVLAGYCETRAPPSTAARPYPSRPSFTPLLAPGRCTRNGGPILKPKLETQTSALHSGPRVIVSARPGPPTACPPRGRPRRGACRGSGGAGHLGSCLLTSPPLPAQAPAQAQQGCAGRAAGRAAHDVSCARGHAARRSARRRSQLQQPHSAPPCHPLSLPAHPGQRHDGLQRLRG